MIDRVTGESLFPADRTRVGPALTHEQFLEPMDKTFAGHGSLRWTAQFCHGLLGSWLAGRSREFIRNEPFCSYRLPQVQWEGHPFSWSLSFEESVLRAVSIVCVAPEFGESWWDWSEERELARMLFHDALLRSTFGTDWQRFPWGTVDSVYR